MSKPDIPLIPSQAPGAKTEYVAGSQKSSSALFSDTTYMPQTPPESDHQGRALTAEKTAQMAGAAPMPSSLSITLNLSSPGVSLVQEEGDLAGDKREVVQESDKYQILREIGRGGMGKVLLWKDNNIGRLVATKMLLSSTHKETIQRFFEEGQITGQLEHPNIVPIHELELDNQGNLYFTMKYVKGQSLKELLHKITHDRKTAEQWSLSKMLQVFLNTCNAVSYAHSKNVIHRDLKPENIMLGNFGEVLVMDWGLAKVVGQGQEVLANDAVKTLRSEGGFKTITGQIAGTPLYMSPEQADGKLQELDHRTDIYALGAMLYEIVSGTTCVENRGTVINILSQVVQGHWRPLPETGLWGKIPGELKSIIHKALAYKREHRYQSVSELGDDVQKFIEGKEVAAYHYSPVDKLYRLVRRYRREIASGVATLVVLVPLFLLWHHEQKVMEADKMLAELETEVNPLPVQPHRTTTAPATNAKRNDTQRSVPATQPLADQFAVNAHDRQSLAKTEAEAEKDSLRCVPLNSAAENSLQRQDKLKEVVNPAPEPGRRVDNTPEQNVKSGDTSGGTPTPGDQLAGNSFDQPSQVHGGTTLPRTPQAPAVHQKMEPLIKGQEKPQEVVREQREDGASKGDKKTVVASNDSKPTIAPDALAEQTRQDFLRLQKTALRTIEKYQAAYQKNPDYRFKQKEADVWMKIYQAAALISDANSCDIARLQIKSLLNAEDYAEMERKGLK